MPTALIYIAGAWAAWLAVVATYNVTLGIRAEIRHLRSRKDA